MGGERDSDVRLQIYSCSDSIRMITKRMRAMIYLGRDAADDCIAFAFSTRIAIAHDPVDDPNRTRSKRQYMITDLWPYDV
jgi:hypothetical protein